MDAIALTKQLGGQWHGAYGVAPCPVCQSERRRGQNALTLGDGGNRLLLNCKRAGCDFQTILAACGIGASNYIPPDPETLARRERENTQAKQKRADQALKVWNSCKPICGTIAETYLRGRGITCDLPDTLRFHPSCFHGATETRHPAMIARVQGGEMFAIHRTYLKPDGTGKADIAPNKAMLGTTAGGAVCVSQGQNTGHLVISEGIETGLSLPCGILKTPATVWAVLSTSGMRGLILPRTPRKLTIAADGDTAGLAASTDLATRATGLGWTVYTLPAPNGMDWNDIIRKRATL